MASLVPIVEGKGEVEAVPVLLRRIFDEMGVYDVTVAHPFRVKRNRVVRPGDIERTVRQAVSACSDARSLLVILDADDDDPGILGPKLLKRCESELPFLPVAVVLAQREFEAWFLGAKESLRGKRGIRLNAVSPQRPESIRGAKEHLSQNMEESRYLPVDDQPALAEYMDMEMARKRCASFDKMFCDIGRLLAEMRSAKSG